MREVDKYIFRSVEIAQNRCDPQNILHASAGYGDLALIFCRNVDYLLQSVHIRGKGRNDYALITIFKQHVERLADLAFGGGQTGLFDIGRVAHKREHALVSELTEARQINDLTLYRREVDFKVTCVDYSSDRRFYSQCDSVGYTVVYGDEFDAEASEAEHIARFFREYLRVIQKIVLLKLELNECRRERRCVYRDIQIVNDIRNSADVILVSVSDDYTSYFFGVGLEIRNVGNDDIYTVHIFIRETETAVDNDNIRAKFNGSHVLADLAETAERNDFQLMSHILTSNMSDNFRKRKVKGPIAASALIRRVQRSFPPMISGM